MHIWETGLRKQGVPLPTPAAGLSDSRLTGCGSIIGTVSNSSEPLGPPWLRRGTYRSHMLHGGYGEGSLYIWLCRQRSPCSRMQVGKYALGKLQASHTCQTPAGCREKEALCVLAVCQGKSSWCSSVLNIGPSFKEEQPQ